MTYAPQTISDLATYWIHQGGVNLGIVGDAAHVAGGVSYHLGKDALVAGAYSARLPRDRAGLTNAAAALDLGKLHGSLTNLQKFSGWLVAEVRAHPAAYRDIREIIYSPDGKMVKRWDNELHLLHDGGTGTGQGDNTHLYHTHISFYRDSEFRAKVSMFTPYFVPVTKPEEPMGLAVFLPATTDASPLDAFGTVKIKGASHAIIRVRDKHYEPVADGKDLGVVQKGTLVTPLDAGAGDRRTVFVFNNVGEQYVALAVDCTPLVPLPKPVDTTPYSKDDVNKAVDHIAGIVPLLNAAISEARAR